MKRAVILAALLSWGAQSSAAPAPVVEVTGNSQLSATDLSGRVERLEQLLRAQSQSQLRLEQMVDQMQREIGELRGQNEQQSYQLEQMVERQRQLYQELTKRQAPAAAAPAKPTGPAVQSLSEADSYTRALNLATKERRFDDAIPAFQQFIEQYPESSYTANAYYWLGQLLYNKGEIDQAREMFSTLSQSYPNSGKRADALLKQGLIVQRQGDEAAAQKFFSQVIEQYAGSSAAKIAQKHIK
ncbi:tol-pal system protein YbgF [Ferrimonas gelatinilytica]|uniref:Cell division coordinator CpoB n=1 Tax=Ferrimonas gelatinilytica TaxID=1255257 RepID=A0ABP9RXG1_9GAMM